MVFLPIDYLYAFQLAFMEARFTIAEMKRIGRTDLKKPDFDWLRVGMDVASGRWDSYISNSQKTEILKVISGYSGVIVKEPAPLTTCLYQDENCFDQGALFPITDIIPDGEMIKSIIFQNGNLIVTTTKQVFTTTIPHNALAGLQGGLDLPGLENDERYHLTKDELDKLNAASYTAAISNLILSPGTGQIGIPVSPSLTISYNKNSDTLTSHTLTRNGVNIPINPLNSNGVGNQTINDVAQSDDAVYVYTVNRLNKSPLVITRTLSFNPPVYFGVTDSTVTPSIILNGQKVAQAKSQITQNFTTNQQYTWVAFPADWGFLTSILNPNGFEQLPSFTQDGYPLTLNIDYGDGPKQYRVYRNDLMVDLSSYQFRFIF